MYTYDLAFIVHDPKKIARNLEGKYKYKLKGSYNISYHLGYDFFRDDGGIFYMAPKKYIKIIDGYKHTFNHKPSTKYKQPLKGGSS